MAKKRPKSGMDALNQAKRKKPKGFETPTTRPDGRRKAIAEQDQIHHTIETDYRVYRNG